MSPWGCGLARAGRGGASVGAFLARLTLAVEDHADRDRREDDHRDQDGHDGRGSAAAFGDVLPLLGAAEVLLFADRAFRPAGVGATALVTPATVATGARGRLAFFFLRRRPFLLMTFRRFAPRSRFARADAATFFRGGTFGLGVVRRLVMGARLARVVTAVPGFTFDRRDFGFVDGFAGVGESAHGE